MLENLRWNQGWLQRGEKVASVKIYQVISGTLFEHSTQMSEILEAITEVTALCYS